MSCSLYVMKMLLDYQETLSVNKYEGIEKEVEFWAQKDNDATHRKADLHRGDKSWIKAACHRMSSTTCFWHVGIQYLFVNFSVLVCRHHDDDGPKYVSIRTHL